MAEMPANWAGNVVFSARQLHRPTSVSDLQRLVAGSTRIRALGTGHSFSPIADTTGDLVSVAGLPEITELDADRASVRVSAGLTYGELARYLDRSGYALRNLGSLPHISIAGACATGTHGSGNTIGCLATAVRAMDIVTAQGDLVTMSRDADGADFRGAVVGLGLLGIVVSLSLDVVPAFDVRQLVYEDLPREQVDDHLADIFSAGYSVSLFTDWAAPRIREVWLKKRVTGQDSPDPGPQWHGGRLADGPRHPVPGMPPAYTTPQLGIPGPWHERLPHFLLEFTPSAGSELQSEYLLPRQRARDAIRAIDQVSDRFAALVQISEIRTVAADDLWLSPSYQRETVAIHFTWTDDVRAVAAVLPVLESQLEPFQARPHWGKLFTMSSEVVAGLYDRLPDFQRLIRRFDPAGKFAGKFTDTYIRTR